MLKLHNKVSALQPSLHVSSSSPWYESAQTPVDGWSVISFLFLIPLTHGICYSWLGTHPARLRKLRIRLGQRPALRPEISRVEIWTTSMPTSWILRQSYGMRFIAMQIPFSNPENPKLLWSGRSMPPSSPSTIAIPPGTGRPRPRGLLCPGTTSAGSTREGSSCNVRLGAMVVCCAC